jgi:ATP-dependent DNA helicase DinG
MDSLRRAIAEAGGNEVTAVCRTDDDGIISDLRVVARGDPASTPAPLPHLVQGDVVVHNHPGGELRPSPADVEVAAELGNQGIGSFIVNNDVTEIYVLVEAVVVPPETPLEPEDLTALIDDGGPLSERLEHYEPRHSQMEMLRAVAQAFNEKHILAAEAGTGVGKSMAYLLPALAWADVNNERVVITTATINLQQQLMEKDIPLAKELLDSSVDAVLVKGRGNYLCPRRLEEELGEAELFQEPSPELSAIRDWARETATGSRSDLPFMPTEPLWQRVNSDADSCSAHRCRSRGDCFILKARREAATAKLLVVNHHLLFSDLSLRLRGLGFDTTAILPPFTRLIFDEAHSIESSATSFFSRSFSLRSLYKHLGRLSRSRQSRRLGLLHTLARSAEDPTSWHALAQQVEALREQGRVGNQRVVELIGEQLPVRLGPELTGSRIAAVNEELRELQSRILSLVEDTRDAVQSLPEDVQENDEAYDVGMVLRRLQDIAGLCASFQEYDTKADEVHWMEGLRDRSEGWIVRFLATPVDIGSVMQEAVFEPYESVTFTSATLTVADSFAYWSGRIGLREEESESGVFPSPFDYARNVLLGLPDDAPEPSDPRYNGWLIDFLTRTLDVSEGKGLILFTSYRMLREVYDGVKPWAEHRGITLFRQGEDERGRLLERFRNDTASCLFATDSFWQGIDSPGETLQVVVLCRLPFRVPSDPVLLARMDAIRAAGGNPFRDLSLPDAVMKLKQGFGRLMRRTSDRGVVLIPDARILRKSYGQVFLASLPEARRVVAPSGSVIEEVESFLYPAAPE